MQQFRQYPRTGLRLGALGLIGLVCAFGGGPGAARGQTKEGKQTAPKNVVSPPPKDVNDLSMEVAALRTLYLLKADANLHQIKAQSEREKPRQRQEANVSPGYQKVLTELRAAYIAGQEDRIFELTDQLEELAKDEDPELDDTIEITDSACKKATWMINLFDPWKIVAYLAAYGKEFPDPWHLMYKTMRFDGIGQKPTPEEWKAIRAFVIREVSWNIGGLDKAKQEQIGAQVAAVLDQAYPLSNEELLKERSKGGASVPRPGKSLGLLGQVTKIVRQAGPTDVLKHVIEQDLAELLSNPRLVPAVEARLQYLKK